MTNWIESSLFIVTLYSTVLLVHVLCPARVVKGYVCDVLKPNEPLVYHLNGLRCLGILLGGFCLLPSRLRLFLAENYLECAVVSNCIGLLASYWFVYKKPLSPQQEKANRLRRAPTVALRNPKQKNETTTSKKLPPQDWDDRGAPFYWGREFNPRFAIPGSSFVLDVKMFLYIIGAVVLGMNLLSALFWEQVLREDGSNSNAILLYVGLFLWFLLDYLWYEEVHTYTYDLFAEKIGFKLLWGCLCFYPFFYPIGILPFVMISEDDANNRTDLDIPSMVAIVILYTIGSILTRGANMQKFYYRQRPHQPTVSLFGGLLVLPQSTVPSSNHRLLCSGFWGCSRHINYCGEILQAVALALPAFLYLGPSWWRCIPWLYPIYYVALFVPRQQDDDDLMRQKYGDKIMDEYLQLVPYRMVPGLY